MLQRALLCVARAFAAHVRSSGAEPLASAGSREMVNFDFAWRFHRAEEPCYHQCAFELGANFGTGQIWAGITASKEECCNECANHDTCRAWAWNGHSCVVRDNSPLLRLRV
eukprot:SAG22_NODE_732_length_7583_cov_3.250134_1_plen_111_part_00